jgi:hypothetical protein
MSSLQQVNNTQQNELDDDGYSEDAAENSFGSSYIYKARQAEKRNGKHFASETNAEITRNNWADYQDRYMPMHGELIGAVSGGELVNQQVGRVGETVNQNFDQANAAMNVNSSRMGLASVANDDSLDRALATTHAKNSTREAGEQRNRTAITGAANSLAPARSGT